MARELDDGEFWLPSDFLTDDDLLTDFRDDPFRTKRDDDFSCGFWNPSGFSSDLSSPVESSMGSMETESDEDDFITFLTRKIAYSTLLDSNLESKHQEQGLKLSGSPQSTLRGYNLGSSRGSPKCVSQVPSPTKVNDTAAWDLLYAAAGEVERMRASEKTKSYYSTKPNPVSGPQRKPSIVTKTYSNPKITQAQISLLQMQAIHFQKMTRGGIWGEEKPGNQFQSGRSVGERQPGLSAAAWPTLRQPHRQPPLVPHSGTRSVFLGENGAKKERTGTGVFLPRRYETITPETRKKPAEATSRVLLAADRAEHALNLNIDSVHIPGLAHFGGVSSAKPEYDAVWKPVASIRMAQQKRDDGPRPVMNQEVWLPQEWTY